MYRSRTNTAPRRGAALLELAVLLPLLFFLVILAIDFGRVCYNDIIVINAARSGAVYGGQGPTYSVNVQGITQAAQADATNLNLQQMTVTATTGTDSAGGPCLDVTVQSPFSTVTGYLVPSTLTVSSRVRTRVIPVLPNSN